jgi:DNA mismatch repair protein MutL
VARIKKLSPETSGKIAAGEVVERPFNVIKELVENSLDASARRIVLEIEGGGKRSIRIDDDGTGIAADDMTCAVENYSTSKISHIDDIYRIRSLGFRGEALASINSVSRMTIRSMEEGAEVGREIRWVASELREDGPFVRTVGTEIIVEDLFFNLPARKKFLSSDASETRRIVSAIQGFALAWPQTAFVMRSNGREVLSFPAGTIEERVEMVLGPSVFPHLKPFARTDGRIEVNGYTSMPSMTKGNRSSQFIFVNGRAVKDRLLGHAVRQAYQSIIPGDRFPIVVLMLDIPPEMLDVNVHPAKAEVRFQNERDIHSLVSSAVREALEDRTVSFRDKVESVYKTIFPQDGSADTEGEIGTSGTYRADEHGRSDWLFQESPQPLFEKDSGKVQSQVSTGLYWQLHDSYIMIQIRGGMVIIDQHAAHERILYDKARRNVEGERSVVQSLLFPATLELSPDEYDSFEMVIDTLPSLGFEAEPFGMRTIIVRGIPSGVRNWDDGILLRTILSDLGRGLPAIDSILRSFACHSAVRAGERLSLEEMESLTDQLFATEFPFTCPHGRPTMLRVEMRELEKRFQRTPKTEG